MNFWKLKIPHFFYFKKIVKEKILKNRLKQKNGRRYMSELNTFQIFGFSENSTFRSISKKSVWNSPQSTLCFGCCKFDNIVFWVYKYKIHPVCVSCWLKIHQICKNLRRTTHIFLYLEIIRVLEFKEFEQFLSRPTRYFNSQARYLTNGLVR
jgi:hypothetical protein